MRFLLINHIQNARDSLRSNRTRSLLTMTGIMIGVASITTILALSAGAGKIVSDQVEALGGNIAVIRPGQVKEESGFEQLTQIPSQQHYAASTLTDSDVESLTRIEGVEAVAPLMVISGAVEGDNEAPKNTPIVATTPELETVNAIAIQEGQFLDPSLSAKTAVIGAQLSIDTFGTEQSIAKTIYLRGQPFTIIGVMKRTNNPVNYNGFDLDRSVIIDKDAGRIINQGITQIQQINVRATSTASLDGILVEMNKVLLRNHFDVPDFTVLSGEEIAQPTSDLFSAIAGITTAIAAISLIVGGIGVMNIMLVSVAERTREIGIRKAVGASNMDIVMQFLIESLALSIGGGFLGYLFGYALAFAISAFVTFDPVFTWQIAGIAALVSFIVGTLFGLYPAVRAARKDPIDALRQYD